MSVLLAFYETLSKRDEIEPSIVFSSVLAMSRKTQSAVGEGTGVALTPLRVTAHSHLGTHESRNDSQSRRSTGEARNVFLQNPPGGEERTRCFSDALRVAGLTQTGRPGFRCGTQKSPLPTGVGGRPEGPQCPPLALLVTEAWCPHGGSLLPHCERS